MPEIALRMSVPTAGCSDARRASAPLHRVAIAFLAWLDFCFARSRQRRALAHLDERLLRDIGITRCDAQMEIEKPFWR